MANKNKSSTTLPGNENMGKDIDPVVAKARREQAQREKTYRERSLKIHPWVCARCGREFTNRNVHLLTVHHKDHNHENNPMDGSNWENLCVYCHENEHRRYLDHLEGGGAETGDEKEEGLTHNPFVQLKGILDKKGE
ncbi:YajD family HNH nuclease [Thermodesulfobacteriota bacterium]